MISWRGCLVSSVIRRLGQVRTSLINFQQTLLQKIESLPLAIGGRQAEQAFDENVASRDRRHPIPSGLRKPDSRFLR